MIVGKGDIARVVWDRPDAIIFASGVSNSQLNDINESLREYHLLKQYFGDDRLLIYFGSLSIYDKDTIYTNHKKTMEGVVRTEFKNWAIIRLGNIDWGTNPNTFLNYIRSRKAEGKHFVIRDEWKYMINKETLQRVVHSVRAGDEWNVFSYMAKVKDLI